MKASLPFLLLACLLFAACSSATPLPASLPITVRYTPAAAPWLVALYDCAGNTAVTADQRAADFLDLRSADLAIRLGQPDNLTTPAYRIGSDDLLVIVNPLNPVTRLTAGQVRGLFSGQVQNWKDVGGSAAAVQVWAFAAAEDLQVIFDQVALGGSPVTSTARLASSPGEMIQAVAADVNAVGILNRHLKTNRVSDAFTVTTVPVLALTPSDPPGVVGNILACLQK
jgi:hypothetical protein